MTTIRTTTIRICFAIGATLAAGSAFAQANGGGGGGGQGGGGAGDGGNDIIAFFQQDKQGWPASPNCTAGAACPQVPVVYREVCSDRSLTPAYVGQGRNVRVACIPRQRR